MFLELALPSLALMVLAVAIPRVIEPFLPETLPGMAVLVLISALILWLASAIGFALLYRLENPQVAELLFSNSDGTRHFLTLGAKAGVIWGPILALVASTTPRRWKTNTW
ncbi:hypothetical protein [uncultured Pelagimonas sp.]|uniref:hypothetical protein n=1 Tax=uncultured Pelagimonas sp. TaxID=1618102 RepID=UPI00260F391B|nr:hypothetical protein [uncultured Pelagimonas sp.]